MTIADLWILLPLLALTAGALLVLLLGAVVPGRYGTAVGVVACLGAAIWTLLTPPLVAAPNLGLSFTPFARFFTGLFTLTGAATLLLSHDYTERRGITGEEYPATVLFAAFGMATVAASVNFLTLFLGLEALTFAFYFLVACDRNRGASAEAGLKYLLLGAVSAALLAFGIALFYAATGSLEIAALRGMAGNPLVLAGWGLVLAGLAFKVSLVPAHLWTPDVYQGAPLPVTAFLATGSKGASFVALLLILGQGGGPAPVRPLLGGLALFSMVVGNLAALRQENLKRLLAYSSIAQMGYVALALLVGTPRGYGAVAFYLVAYTAMGLAAFGAVAALSDDTDLEQVAECRGLGYRRPFVAGVLALALFALAGIPPTVGFTGKFLIFYAALEARQYLLAVLGILTAAASAYYYLRVVVQLYLHAGSSDSSPSPTTASTTLVLGIAAGLILILGIYPLPLLDLIASILD